MCRGNLCACPDHIEAEVASDSNPAITCCVSSNTRRKQDIDLKKNPRERKWRCRCLHNIFFLCKTKIFILFLFILNCCLIKDYIVLFSKFSLSKSTHLFITDPCSSDTLLFQIIKKRLDELNEECFTTNVHFKTGS